MSAPIYRLKHRAKLLARQHRIPHHEALNRIARQEGFASWSLLARHHRDNPLGRTLYSSLENGELLLVGARPGHGKTLLCLQIAIEAMKARHSCFFFSLEYSAAEMVSAFTAVDEQASDYADQFTFDNSDDISAAHMIEQLGISPQGTLLIVDYLQALDQRRENPQLAVQMEMLKLVCAQRGWIALCISQIHRDYDPQARSVPNLNDVRLPNPLELSLFDKACFLNDGKVAFNAIATAEP